MRKPDEKRTIFFHVALCHSPPTSHLPPSTFYLLPSTFYLLPATCYLLPATCYLLPATCYLPPVTWIHTFSAKERDTETGYSYFGSRYYNSDLSIWLSVDPMSDKYPSLSPYVYCANNPIKLVDPNGEEIVIIGSDGTSIKYSPGMKYCGMDESVKNKIDILNKMNTTKSGKKVIDELCNSTKNTYSIIDKVEEDGPVEAYFCANDNVNGGQGGMIVTNGNNDLKTFSHELFHGYQDERKQGGNSIHNEVEAMLFEFSVLVQSSTLCVNPLKSDDEIYNKSVGELMKSYSKDIMEDVVYGFKQNAKGKDTYQNYPLRRNNQNISLIKDFYPLF